MILECKIMVIFRGEENSNGERKIVMGKGHEEGFWGPSNFLKV